MFDANPCALVGWCSVNANTIAGASFGFAGTPDEFGEVKVVSSAASVATDLIVNTVAEPTAALSLADISKVFDVYPELFEVNFNNVV